MCATAPATVIHTQQQQHIADAIVQLYCQHHSNRSRYSAAYVQQRSSPAASLEYFTHSVHSDTQFPVAMSTFGRLFRVSTFGESHCYSVGCVVEGVAPRMHLTAADIQQQLNRRRPGQSALTTARQEKDAVVVMSGVEHEMTLGTPIAMMVRNEDQRPHDYSSMADVPRPSHADYTYQCKYGIRASSGGGRASARETIARVAAGAIAEKWLQERYGVQIVAWVSSVGDIDAPGSLVEQSSPVITRELVDANTVRCPHSSTAEAMTKLIEQVKADQDSVGGVVTCVIRNVPAGLGEPTFDKLEAKLGHAMLSIPATKGFEIGSGFEGAKQRGSAHNDMFMCNAHLLTSHAAHAAPTVSTASVSAAAHHHAHCTLETHSNRSGGIQGGISNGQNITMRIAFKPPATIGRAQRTVDFHGQSTVLAAEGRHDPCVVPRAVPIVEAMAALVLADAALIQLSRSASASVYDIAGKVSSHTHKTHKRKEPQHEDSEKASKSQKAE